MQIFHQKKRCLTLKHGLTKHVPVGCCATPLTNLEVIEVHHPRYGQRTVTHVKLHANYKYCSWTNYANFNLSI